MGLLEVALRCVRRAGPGECYPFLGFAGRNVDNRLG